MEAKKLIFYGIVSHISQQLISFRHNWTKGLELYRVYVILLWAQTEKIQKSNIEKIKRGIQLKSRIRRKKTEIMT